MGTVAAVGIGLGALSGCGLVRATLTDDATLSEQVTSVRLDGDSGEVVVRGQAGPVTIHRRVEYVSTAPGPTHRVENGVLVLAECGNNCSVDYTVTVPPGIPVSGKSSSGGVELTGLGAVDIDVDSGGVRLDGISGAVDVETSSGGITGKGLNGGPIRARASSGGIDLTATTPQDVRAEASSGGVTITVPAGAYKVITEAGSGDEKLQITNDPAGAHTLDLRTDSGNITINKT